MDEYHFYYQVRKPANLVYFSHTSDYCDSCLLDSGKVYAKGKDTRKTGVLGLGEHILEPDRFIEIVFERHVKYGLIDGGMRDTTNRPTD